MNFNSMVAPTKYLQGKGLLGDVYNRISHLGKRFAFLVDDVVYDIVKEKIESSFGGTEGKYEFIFFEGESTEKKALEIADTLIKNNIDVAVGVGGGKIIDAAKLAALKAGVKNVIIPTSAASDAPCTANSVVYDDNGAFLRGQKLPENPAVVLVDTEIIANAPARLFIAGIGDAFVTYYEARACKAAGVANLLGGSSTITGFEVSRLCRDVLLEYGKKAVEDVKNHICSDEVEAVTEANIYLSGVGFENNGVALSHATYNGLTNVFNHYEVMHGEGVAFGLFVELITEYTHEGTWNDAEWNRVVDFYKSVGLPTKFSDVKVNDTSDAFLEKLAKAISENVNSTHEPFEVTKEMLFESLKKLREMDL